MDFNKEFQVGKHGIGWLDRDFTNAFKDSEFVSVFTPTFQKLPRNMSDAEIESELKPGICTLGDVLAFIDNAPQECKDGWANIFYFPSFVVRVHWSGDGWGVGAWDRDDDDWFAGYRVFSPATAKHSGTGSSAPDSLTLESLDARITKLEHSKEFSTETLESQVERLARFILKEYPKWPGNEGESEGAIDCAIRIMRDAKKKVSKRKK